MGSTAALLTTLFAYHLLLLGIGFWATRRTRDGEDYYLGGRGLGAWVSALSSAASSSSAWTLLGVSGAAFTHGLSAVWILPACLGGFALNWFVVAGPLRRLAAESGAVTLTEVLTAGFPAQWKRVAVVSASVIVLLCLGTYVSSQFQAAGKTFAEILEVDPALAVLAGGGVVLLYTMVGGFWAVSVTDLVQGLVMAVASVAVPVAALLAVGGPAGMFDGLGAVEGDALDPWRGMGGLAALGLVVGTLGIGLGYPGQPHVVNRYMALRDEAALRRGRAIAMGWALLIYLGMLVTGWCGRVLVEQLGDGEVVLLRLTTDLFPAAVAGVIVAAVLSAIMSTADSQLLVCGSTVAHDLPHRAARGRIGLDRLAVTGLSLAAIVAAIQVQETIFNTVLFAWSGLGAAFGPLLLVRLLRGPVRARWALASMWLGFATTLVWFFTPALKGALYELVPAFALAAIPAWIGSSREDRSGGETTPASP